MAQRQCTDVQDRPTEFLELTSLTRDEFQQLVPPFAAVFQVHMAAWRLDGEPQIGGCLCSRMRRRTPCRWSRVASLAWARAQPISESTCSGPCCWWPCAPSVMPLPVP